MRPTKEQQTELLGMFQALTHEQREAFLAYGRKLLSPSDVDWSMLDEFRPMCCREFEGR